MLAITWKGMFILGTICALMTVGFAIAMKSGSMDVASGPGLRRLVVNFSKAVVLLGACLVGLAFIQQAVGYNLTLR